MKKCDHFVSFKTESGRNNVKQYNALINLTRDHKFGVRASYLLDFVSFLKLLASLLWDIDSHFCTFLKLLASLLWDIDSHYCTFLKLLASLLWDIDSHYCTFLKLLASLLWDIDSHYCTFLKLLASLLWDIGSHYCTFLKLLASLLWDIDSHYCTFLKLLASLLWDIDSHYCTMRKRGCHFSKIEKKLLGFNNPKKHGHSVKLLDIPVVEQKLVQVEMMLDRKYMESSHMKPFFNMMRTVCDSVIKYLEYCDSQKQRVYTLHQRFYRGRRPIN